MFTSVGHPSGVTPYEIGKDGTRDEVIEKYRVYLYDSGLIMHLSELRGKVLGCWCAPKACHGDILVHLIEDVIFYDRGPTPEGD